MTDTRHDVFADLTDVADAVLFEGYMLYPYRANDAKNQVRWQFGVLAPPSFAAADPSERDHLQTDCLVEGYDVDLTIAARFLQVQRRTVEAAVGDTFVPVDSLDVGAATYLPWDEAVVCEHVVHVTLPGIGPRAEAVSFVVPGGTSDEPLVADGEVAGRLVRESDELTATLTVSADRVPGPYGVRRLRLRLTNATRCEAANRQQALRHALIAAHLLVAADHGVFVSLLDPPEWAAQYVQRCEQVGVFPVLGGSPGDRSRLLASPIILYDHPAVAPESSLQFCDATEMDEMLALRTLTLTEDEKRQARGSDARAAALVDQVDHLPAELVTRLHGVIRSMSNPASPAARDASPPPWWDAKVDSRYDPQHDVVLVDGVPVGRGAAVRLRPGRRRADAQDMFLDGRCATVEAVLFDADDAPHLAVTLDDLAADGGYNPHGRFLYFAPDEVEPIPAGAP